MSIEKFKVQAIKERDFRKDREIKLEEANKEIERKNQSIDELYMQIDQLYMDSSKNEESASKATSELRRLKADQEKME